MTIYFIFSGFHSSVRYSVWWRIWCNISTNSSWGLLTCKLVYCIVVLKDTITWMFPFILLLNITHFLAKHVGTTIRTIYPWGHLIKMHTISREAKQKIVHLLINAWYGVCLIYTEHGVIKIISHKKNTYNGWLKPLGCFQY